MSSLQETWQNTHRGKLHDPSSWCKNAEISLTYVPTSAGATGSAQLARFCALFPAELHPFSPGQLTRYNNQFEVVSCSVDERTKTITEEIVVSALHQERLEYILPGVEAQHSTFVLPFILVAKYSQDEQQNGLLQQVRIYWDQATLLKQMGVFQMAFHNLIRAAGNSVTFEHELDTLPIVDGMKIARRLIQPTMQNCNSLTSLESLERKTDAPRPAKLLSPKLALELPVLNLSTRPAPHTKSSLFAPEDSTPAPVYNNQARHYPAAMTALGDGSDKVIQPNPLHVPKSYIFGSEENTLAQRPSITVDPHRNESQVFKEPTGPFQPQIPLTENSRFSSKIFADSPMKIDSLPRHKPLQHQSNIFAQEEEATPIIVKAAVAPCPFEKDTDSQSVIEQPKAAAKNESHRGNHFHGSGFSFADEDAPLPSFSGRRPDPRANRSSINFAADDEPRAAAISQASARNASKLKLGDDGEQEPPVLPSTRVLQPPGGRTSIHLE